MFICNRSLEDLDRSDIDIKFFFRKFILISNAVFINSKSASNCLRVYSCN